MLFLSDILIYPVKSLGGISVREALVQLRGLQYDRRWMLTDADGLFVSQREVPEMALLGAAIEPPFLRVFVKKDPSQQVLVPLEYDATDKKRVQIWSQHCMARMSDHLINEWFSDVLRRRLHLVHMPDSTRRTTDGRYAPKGQYVSFADAFPFLIIGEATLGDLNSRLTVPVPMDRFRPNLVFSGGTPFAEDEWRQFDIGEAVFSGVKPCARCIMITTDQQTAARNAEPLKTLSGYRRSGNKVLFGQNAVCLNAAAMPVIRKGDSIQITLKKS